MANAVRPKGRLRNNLRRWRRAAVRGERERALIVLMRSGLVAGRWPVDESRPWGSDRHAPCATTSPFWVGSTGSSCATPRYLNARSRPDDVRRVRTIPMRGQWVATQCTPSLRGKRPARFAGPVQFVDRVTRELAGVYDDGLRFLGKCRSLDADSSRREIHERSDEFRHAPRPTERGATRGENPPNVSRA